MTMERRSILKACGIGTTGLLAGSTVGSAKSDDKYWGLVYDPKTQEIIGDASGHFDLSGSGLNGTLTIEDDRKSEIRNYSVNLQTPDREKTANKPGVRTYVNYIKPDSNSPAPAEKHCWATSGRTVSGTIRDQHRDTIAFTLFHEHAKTRSEPTLDIERKEKSGKDIKRSNISGGNTNSAMSTSDNSGDYTVFSYLYSYGKDEEMNDDWQIVSYLSNEKDSRYDADQLPNGEFTRWNLQSYFDTKPTPPADTDVTMFGDDYFITCVPGLNPNTDYEEDSDIMFSSEHPRPSDNFPFDFSIGLSAGIGAVTAGPSMSVGLDLSRTDFEYNHSYSEWSLATNGFPTDQQDNNGVYLTVETSTDAPQKDFEWVVDWHWMYDGPNEGRDPNMSHVFETHDKTMSLDVVNADGS